MYVSPKNEFIDSFKKIYHKKIYKEKEYICSIFKVGIKVIEKKNTNIELNIILKKDNTEFESKNNLDLKSNNFLGLIKFEDYIGWLRRYKPPEIYNLSKYEIINILNEVLLIKEKIEYSDNIYYDFMNYGFDLYNACTQNKLEFFILLYINILKGDIYLLIEKIFKLFSIENNKNNENNFKYLLAYINDLEIIYKRQNKIFDKFVFYISNKILNYNLEFYLKKFYTIYIYILSLLEDNNNIESIFKDLSYNKFDILILPKLYLSEYHKFYENIQISNKIQLILVNKLIEASISYSNLITAFTLISKYVNRNFLKILTITICNYDKINKICFEEKKEIKIIDYIELNIKDKLKKIKKKLDFILKKKKEYNYKCVCFSVDIFLFYNKNSTNIGFLCFLENKLFENSINFEDIKIFLIFSSNKRDKRINPVLELILNKFEKINLLSKEENKKIILFEYIKPNIEDDLLKSKNLISAIVEKQKLFSYNCIKFDIEMFEFYSKTDDFVKLKLIQSTINIIKEIDSINEERICLSKKIHKVGMKMIKERKMKNNKVLQFLKEDELLYNDKIIEDLISTTDSLYNENYYIRQRYSELKTDLYNKNREIVESIKNLNDKLDSALKDIKGQVKEINTIKNNITGLEFDMVLKKNRFEK